MGQSVTYRVGVDVSEADLELGPQLVRVGQVAVVRGADAVRVVGEERLGLGARRAAGRRVAHVAYAVVAL